MIRYLAVRLVAYAPTLFAISIILFLAINVAPGGAAQASLGINATPEAVERFNREHGLDRPLYEQYVNCSTRSCRGISANPSSPARRWGRS